VDYVLPSGLTLDPGAFLVIANNPADVLAKHGVAAFGPWTGALNNAGERVALHNATDALVDEVTYSDGGLWSSEADGAGPSLELISPLLDNAMPSAWGVASGVEGSPGQVNANIEANPAPLITDVVNAPVVPTSGDSVLVTARIMDADGLSSAHIRWRRDTEMTFNAEPMFDDGAHGDAASGDGVFGGTVPAQPDGAVIEFHIEATDTATGTRLAPNSAPTGNFLWQVDDDAHATPLPLMRVVMTERDWTELTSRPVTSDALLNATFAFDDTAWHRVGVRYRGRSARFEAVKSYRIEFEDEPFDSPLPGITELNLNAVNPHRQHLGMDLFRRAGLPAAESRLVSVVVRNQLEPVYVQMESYDDTFLSRFYGDANDSGNLYRGEMNATLEHLGPDFDAYRVWYEKHSNGSADDYSDIVALTDAFTNASDADFPAAIDALIDVDEWLRFFAVNTALSNQEGSIYNSRGDDYYLYRNPATDLFEILPWDMDVTFIQADETIFRPELPAIVRLVAHPEFVGRYHQAVRELREGAFDIETMWARIDSEAAAPVSSAEAEQMRAFTLFRHDDLAPQSPQVLSGGFTYDQAEIIPLGVLARFFRGVSEPSAGSSWTELGFDDATWELGATGIASFATSRTGTLLTDLPGYTTLYLRLPFGVADPAAVRGLFLDIEYDDGFVAYLNGVEVRRSNINPFYAEGQPVPFDGNALFVHPAGQSERWDLSDQRDLLVGGENILAIQALTTGAGDPGLGVFPELTLELGPPPVISGAPGDVWQSRAGTDEPVMPPDLPSLSWHETNFRFEDAGFTTQPGPFGHGHAGVQTDLSAMQGVNTSHFIRRLFATPGPEAVTGLRLRIRYDDAFVTFINGEEVLRRNVAGVPGRPVPFDAVAQAVHTASMTPEVFDLSAHIGKLRPGSNTLAVMGIAAAFDDDSFLIDAKLEIDAFPAGLFLEGDENQITLTGLAPVESTRTVRVNSAPADLDLITGRWSGTVSLREGLSPIRVTAHDAANGILDVANLDVIRAGAPLAVAGTLAGDTTWRAENGVVKISGDLTVPEGTMLRIEPGAIVVHAPNAVMTVNGGLEVGGDPDRPVIFTSATVDSPWYLWTIVEPDTPTIIEDALFNWGALLQSLGSMHLARSTVRNVIPSPIGIPTSSLFVDRSDIEMVGCLFEDNHAQFLMFEPADAHIRGNTFRRIRGDHDGIDFITFEGPGLPFPVVVEQNIIEDVGDDGIDSDVYSIIARDNFVRGALDKGISTASSSFQIERNRIIDCGIGYYLKFTGTADLVHNSIAGGRVGILLEGDTTAALRDSIIWGISVVPIITRDTATVTFDHSDVPGGVQAGEGNISADPLYADPGSNNLALLPGSPAIGAASDGTDMGAVQSNPSGHDGVTLH
jgi:hypothetical protein